MTEESEKTGETIREVAERRRPRIEHAQIMTDEDITRLGKLGGKHVSCSTYYEDLVLTS